MTQESGQDQLIGAEESAQTKLFKQHTETNAVFRQVAKKEWIKTSFWMPENGTEVSNQLVAPVSKLVCPYSKDQ